jgi:hypothetical protein
MDARRVDVNRLSGTDCIRILWNVRSPINQRQWLGTIDIGSHTRDRRAPLWIVGQGVGTISSSSEAGRVRLIDGPGDWPDRMRRGGDKRFAKPMFWGDLVITWSAL